MENSILGFPEPNFSKNQQPPVSLILATLALLAILGAGLGAIAAMILANFYGIPPDDLQGIIRAEMPAADRSFVRWMLAINHLSTFVLPGALTLWLFCRRDGSPVLPFGSLRERVLPYLQAERLPSVIVLLISILMMIAALPLVHFLYGVNKMLPLPDWMVGMEEQTNEALKGILKMDSPLEMLANLCIMALIPAVGEELVFRGIVQRQLMRVISNDWLAILAAGAIFSAIHLQFEGFLPRWLLGCLLGWLFWQTKNFWVPVAVHFFNNAFQVVGQYFFQEKISSLDFEQDFDVPTFYAALSLVLVLLAAWLLKKFPPTN